MDFNAICQTVASVSGPILTLLIQIIICVLAVVGTRLLNKLFSKIGVELTENEWDTINQIVTQVVKTINQKYVDTFKEESPNGKLTDEQQTMVYENAYNMVIGMLSNKQIQLLIDKYGAVADGIKVMIESAVVDAKKESIAVVEK